MRTKKYTTTFKYDQPNLDALRSNAAFAHAAKSKQKVASITQTRQLIKPKLVVGVPVGFVGAAESKKELENFDFPYIRINGRKGGSTVAVAILHGILYGMKEFKDRLDG